MTRTDKYTSIICAGFGLYIVFQGYRLNLGSMRSPKSGFFIFGAGIVLLALSLILLAQALYSKPQKKIIWKGLQWAKGIKLMLALFVYALVFRWMGFFLSTLLLLLFLFKGLEPQKWRTALVLTLITITFCYLIFGVFLEFQFPEGILEKVVNGLVTISRE